MSGPNLLLVILAAAEYSTPLTEHEVLLVIVQLVALVAVARIFGWVMKSLNQPPVIGEILAGVVLGPTVLGRWVPDVHAWLFGDTTVGSVMFGISWLGVILLLVVIGFETDLGIIARFKGAAASVSAGALLLPMILFVFAGLWAPDSFVGEGVDKTLFAVFLALALLVSALPVVAKILQDLGYMRRNFGQITLAAAMTMDSVGWLLLAAASGVALGGFRATQLALSFGGLILFLIVAATVGRWILDRLFRTLLDRGSSVIAALSITIVSALIGAAVTQALRLEAILGAFVVGVILSTTRHQLPQVRNTLETVSAAFFAPIFFAYSGLRVDVGLLNTAEELAYSVARHTDGEVLALHVVTRPEGLMVEQPAVDEGRRTGEDLVAAAIASGERMGATVRAAVRMAPNAEEEILEVALQEEIDLLILGASSRNLVNRPFFGHRVSYMTEHSTIPVAVVALPTQPSISQF